MGEGSKAHGDGPGSAELQPGAVSGLCPSAQSLPGLLAAPGGCLDHSPHRVPGDPGTLLSLRRGLRRVEMAHGAAGAVALPGALTLTTSSPYDERLWCRILGLETFRPAESPVANAVATVP